MIRIREFRLQDATILRNIFYRAVQEGSTGFYDQAQRDAWSGAASVPPDWSARLGDHITLVAENRAGPCGFMTLGHDGHLDLAFVAPEVMGRGVAAALHDRVIAVAQEHHMPRLTTEASHLARRFFRRQGWREIREQQVELNGVFLTNFVMDKRVSARAEAEGL